MKLWIIGLLLIFTLGCINEIDSREFLSQDFPQKTCGEYVVENLPESIILYRFANNCDASVETLLSFGGLSTTPILLNDESEYFFYGSFYKGKEKGENTNYFYSEKPSFESFKHSYSKIIESENGTIYGYRTFKINPVVSISNVECSITNEPYVLYKANYEIELKVIDWRITDCVWVTEEGEIIKDE